MARINIPFDALASRLNLSGRLDGLQSQSIMSRVSTMKGLGDFFDFKRMSRPHGFGEVQSRVNYNLSYFSSNYIAIFFMLTIYTLFSNLLLFSDIVFVIGGLWAIKKLDGRDLDLGFVRATTSQLYTVLVVIAVPIGFISNPFGSALWLIGASGVSILGHAAFMDKPIESAFGEEAV